MIPIILLCLTSLTRIFRCNLHLNNFGTSLHEVAGPFATTLCCLVKRELETIYMFWCVRRHFSWYLLPLAFNNYVLFSTVRAPPLKNNKTDGMISNGHQEPHALTAVLSLGNSRSVNLPLATEKTAFTKLVLHWPSKELFKRYRIQGDLLSELQDGMPLPNEFRQ